MNNDIHGKEDAVWHWTVLVDRAARQLVIRRRRAPSRMTRGLCCFVAERLSDEVLRRGDRKVGSRGRDLGVALGSLSPVGHRRAPTRLPPVTVQHCDGFSINFRGWWARCFCQPYHGGFYNNHHAVLTRQPPWSCSLQPRTRRFPSTTEGWSSRP